MNHSVAMNRNDNYSNRIQTTITVKPNGVLIGIYFDDFDYDTLGSPVIRRVSRVEPNTDGKWTADLSPVDGPVLGPFEKRCDAIDAEINWLNLMLNEMEPE